MAAGGNAQQSLRKALGALKDSTTVGLAKVNSENKELDVAIVKATNHVEKLAKDKHIQKIFDAVSASRPRADVAYCIHALARRLAKTHNWAVALKTLIVIHRALREVDPTFREELINYSRSRGLILNLSHFKDESSPNAWDYSAWVRNYALYLEECLECFRILKYDVQTNCSRTKELDTLDLIEHLPALQQVLFRLLSCQPKGTARYNYLIQYAFAIVAAESVRIYVAITDGTLNLIDKFFEMQRHDAVRALSIYQRAAHQAERLSEFLELCRSLDFGRGQKYIKIEQPPASFLAAMEDYVKDAPQTLMLPWRESNDDRVATPRAVAAPEPDLETDHKLDNDDEEKSDPIVTSPELNDHNEAEATPQPEVTDLLGLGESTQEASELDDKNAWALAIFTPENPSNFENSSTLACQSTDWELALVTAPSSNGAAVAESTLAGGLDRLTLDSLYDNAVASTNQNGDYHMGQVVPNPLEGVHYTQDIFYASSNITPPTSVQMAPDPLEGVHYTQDMFDASSNVTPPTSVQMAPNHLEAVHYTQDLFDASSKVKPPTSVQMAPNPLEAVYYSQDLFHASSKVKPPTSVQMAPNPLEAVYYSQDLFHASSNITPPTSVQMAVMGQQQEALIVQQQQSMIGCDPTNPFRNRFC